MSARQRAEGWGVKRGRHERCGRGVGEVTVLVLRVLLLEVLLPGVLLPGALLLQVCVGVTDLCATAVPACVAVHNSVQRRLPFLP